MCGITGILDTLSKADVDQALLDRMNESQHHRGPDEGGLHQVCLLSPFSAGNQSHGGDG